MIVMVIIVIIVIIMAKIYYDYKQTIMIMM